MIKKTDRLFLLPAALGLLLFWVIPFFASLGYAFIDNNFARRFVGLQNLGAVVENPYFRLALKNTMVFSLCAVVLVMVLSVVIAFLIAKYAVRWNFLRGSLFLPVLLPSATIVMFWHAYFAEMSPFSSLLAMFLWKYLGLNVMLILTAVVAVPRELSDAAQIDGAGAVKTHLLVILPYITPSLFFTLILSFVNSMKIYRESFLLYGSYPDESIYMLQNYLDNHFGKLNYPTISSAAILFAVVIYVIVGVVYLLEKRWEDRIW